jgi:hypothetical protein
MSRGSLPLREQAATFAAVACVACECEVQEIVGPTPRSRDDMINHGSGSSVRRLEVPTAGTPSTNVSSRLVLSAAAVLERPLAGPPYPLALPRPLERNSAVTALPAVALADLEQPSGPKERYLRRGPRRALKRGDATDDGQGTAVPVDARGTVRIPDLAPGVAVKEPITRQGAICRAEEVPYLPPIPDHAGRDSRMGG